eukprot:403375042
MNFVPFQDDQENEEVKQQLAMIPKNDKLFQAKSQIMQEIIQDEENKQNQNNQQQLQLNKQSSQQSNSNSNVQDEMVKKIVMMGFDMDIVQYAAVKVQYQSVEAILEFLTKDNDGLYQHDFVEMHGQLCYICQEDISQHANQKDFVFQEALLPEYRHDAKSKKDSFILDNELLFNQPNLIKERSKNIADKLQIELAKIKSEDEICIICFEPRKDYFEMNECGHRFLNPIDDKLFDKFLKFKQRKLLQMDPLVKWCPAPGCEHFVKADNDKVQTLTCECGTKICFQCGNEFHGTRSCKNQMEDQFKGWAQNNNIRYCPKCKIRVEKDEGCNHMTCFYCGFEFCWICGGTYTSDHFAPLNPLGCSGYRYGDGRNVSWMKLLLHRVFKLICLIIIAPFFIICATPFACTAICFTVTTNRSSFQGLNRFRKFFGILMGFSGFAIGLACDIVTVPLIIVIGIPLLIAMFVSERVSRHRRANRTLRDRLALIQNFNAENNPPEDQLQEP